MAESDLELLARWREGDRQAGNVLVGRHFLVVRCYFANRLPDEHEDLVQETFKELVASRDAFRGEASFRTYLFRIARNVLATHLRWRYKQARHFEPATSSIIDLCGRRPSSLMLEHERERLLLEALRGLPFDDQDLLEIYYWQDLTGGEIAGLFQIPEPTVRSRIRAALGRLRHAYATLGDGNEPTVDELDRALDEIGKALSAKQLRFRSTG